MSYQNEWLLFEAEDEFDEIKHREPTEELLFYRAVASGDIKTVRRIVNGRDLQSVMVWEYCQRMWSQI